MSSQYWQFSYGLMINRIILLLSFSQVQTDLGATMYVDC
jgi:hypothetical protein